MPDELTPGAEPDDDITLTVDRTRASERRVSGAQEARPSHPSHLAAPADPASANLEAADPAAQHEALDLTDTTPRAAPITTAPAARRPFAATLTPHPPVNDYRRLDFNPPEVLPGRTVRYPVRVGSARELPDFVAYSTPSARVASVGDRRGRAAAVVAAGEVERSSVWRARAAWAITGSTVVAAVVAVAGFYGLARL